MVVLSAVEVLACSTNTSTNNITFRAAFVQRRVGFALTLKPQTLRLCSNPNPFATLPIRENSSYSPFCVRVVYRQKHVVRLKLP